ncbi:MAG TPA: biopolymer transporter ExbD [Planctomycetota bacterium]|nr:biopolymer transporter ExbD [Planctomycetota bacterium]
MNLRRDPGRAQASFNLTPLLDMLFILIVFFLATSRFQEDERDEAIRLVESRSKLPIATATDLLVIEVLASGEKRVHGQAKSLEEIEEILRERIAQKKGSDVVIRADRRALVGHLQETTEICHRLGLETPKIAYAQGS